MNSASNRFDKERKRASDIDKDSFWALAVVVVFVVVMVTFGFSLYVDSRAGHLAGGIADETGALGLAQTALALVQERR